MKLYNCGLCEFSGTRKGLREHLKKEHRIVNEITNTGGKMAKKVKQNWWNAQELTI